MATASAYVYIHTPEGTVLLAPGDEVPNGTVTNPAALAEEPKDEKPAANRRKAASE